MMYLLTQINWIMVAVVTVLTFALGALWYGPLFGKAWLKATGLDPEKLGSSSKSMILTFFLNLGTSIVIAMAVGGFDIIHWPNGVILGFGLGMGIYGFNLYSDFLFQRQSMKLLASPYRSATVCSAQRSWAVFSLFGGRNPGGEIEGQFGHRRADPCRIKLCRKAE